MGWVLLIACFFFVGAMAVLVSGYTFTDFQADTYRIWRKHFCNRRRWK